MAVWLGRADTEAPQHEYEPVSRYLPAALVIATPTQRPAQMSNRMGGIVCCHVVAFGHL